MPQTYNLKADALRRQMDSAYERSKNLPGWLTRSGGQFVSGYVEQESSGTSQKESQHQMGDPRHD